MGPYQYTTEGEEGYFSDDDVTVKVNGKSGRSCGCFHDFAVGSLLRV